MNKKVVKVTTSNKKFFTANDTGHLDKAAVFGKLLIDDNKDGVPDILEDLGTASGNSTTIEINGQTYSSWDDVPAEYADMKEKFANIAETDTKSGTTISLNLSDSQPQKIATKRSIEVTPKPNLLQQIAVGLGILFVLYLVQQFLM